jgi:protein-disulfide isomerase
MSRLTIPVSEYDHQKGNLDARITVVEYGDYQCPFCALAHPLVKRLLLEQGGIIRFVFRNFPMQTVHPYALSAALAAEAASRQHRFSDMHDILFDNQAQFDEDFFPGLARQMNMNMQQFDADFRSEQTLSKVNGDFKSGLHSGVNGTPSFFINDEKITLPELSYDALLEAVVRQINVVV